MASIFLSSLKSPLALRWFGAMSLSVSLMACDAKPPQQSWEVAAKGTYSAALSNDGQFSLIGSIYHGGSLWQTKTHERRYDWNHKAGEKTNVIASGFSPDGQFALTADHQTMVLWDTSNGEAVTYWIAPNEVMSVDLTPRGEAALLGLPDPVRNVVPVNALIPEEDPVGAAEHARRAVDEGYRTLKLKIGDDHEVVALVVRPEVLDRLDGWRCGQKQARKQ